MEAQIPFSTVVIRAYTPQGIFTTPEIALDEKTAEFVQSLKNNLHNKLLLRLPIGADEEVILPASIVANSAFVVKYNA